MVTNLGISTETIVLILLFPVLVIMMAQNLVYIFQLIATVRQRIAEPMRIGTQRDLWMLQSRQSLAVSLIAPAFNEELTVAQSVRSLLSLNYPVFEIIIVNDGSSDATLDILIREFNLVPRSRQTLSTLDHQPIKRTFSSIDHPALIVVDKVNGRKADAVNAGVAVARHPLLCVVDCDSLMENDALLRATQPFLGDDGSIIAVGGSIRLTNGCNVSGGQVRTVGLPDEWIARFQILEYLRAFMVARVSASRWGLMMLISGAFGVFRRDAVIEVGGFDHDSRGEDLELIVRLHRKAAEEGRSSKVLFVPDAVCWTEAPFNYGGIRNQRARWTQGGLEVLMKHKTMLFNRRYNRIGLFGLPMVLLETALVPVAELVGYAFVPLLLYLQMSSAWWLLGMLVASLLFGTAVSLGALLFEEAQMRRHDSLREVAMMLLCAFVENIGYRQMNAWFRILGMRDYLKKRTAWLAVPRQGFAATR